MSRWFRTLNRTSILVTLCALTIVGATCVSFTAYPLVARAEGIGSPASPVTLTDNRSVSGLAAHLRKIGARMYGAYWCPHCNDQKELFGAAFSNIDYVECDPGGKNSRPSLCQKAKITGYPTWEIKGKLYPGTQSLEELAKLSGYSGPSNF